METAVAPGAAVEIIASISISEKESDRGIFVNTRYNIQASSCNDYCTILWCTPCALCQEFK
jgi:Cys-rich protein (TIGR01571 family)